MRKVILLMHVSLDGFVAGPAGEMDWILYDEELFEHVCTRFSHVGTAIYGRTTYEMMAGYWPTVLRNPASTPLERHHADWVETVEKVVFSTTLPATDWHNTTLLRGNLTAEITRLKQLPGKDLMLFGSPRLAHAFMALGLIDEYLLNLNPTVLGAGIPLFDQLPGPAPLQLLDSWNLSSGVVSLRYQVKAEPAPGATQPREKAFAAD